MGDGDVRMNLPGLLRERLPSGAHRYRVRVAGNAGRRIALTVTPDHPDFLDHYRDARAGVARQPRQRAAEHGTLAWLAGLYLKHLAAMVDAGQASALTLKERRSLSAYVLAQKSQQPRSAGRDYAGLPAVMPAAELHAFKDRMASKPGKARNVWKFLRAMYDYGIERGHVTLNPARAVTAPVYRSAGGAVPWSLDDLKRFRDTHGPGTMAHLALTLFMFTACRIGDAHQLGRQHERQDGAVTWLDWQPSKKGSHPVSIPMLPPLVRAVKAQTVVGPTYLLTAKGKPFASPEALRNRLQKWCAQAGIEDRSAHGIRKAAGHLLALHGATQYEIMAVHGHANASTSEIYTAGVERRELGRMATARLASLDW